MKKAENQTRNAEVNGKAQDITRKGNISYESPEHAEEQVEDNTRKDKFKPDKPR